MCSRRGRCCRHQGVEAAAADEGLAAVAAAPQVDVVAFVAVHDVAVRLRALLRAADDDVVAPAAADRVAAEQTDQDVVTVLPSMASALFRLWSTAPSG